MKIDYKVTSVDGQRKTMDRYSWEWVDFIVWAERYSLSNHVEVEIFGPEGQNGSAIKGEYKPAHTEEKLNTVDEKPAAI
jgi:hypothetical protein